MTTSAAISARQSFLPVPTGAYLERANNDVMTSNKHQWLPGTAERTMI